jgi:hypothetical protein
MIKYGYTILSILDDNYILFDLNIIYTHHIIYHLILIFIYTHH